MVDYEKLGELIDGYGGISADDLHALPSVADAREDEIARLKEFADGLRKRVGVQWTRPAFLPRMEFSGGVES